MQEDSINSKVEKQYSLFDSDVMKKFQDIPTLSIPSKNLPSYLAHGNETLEQHIFRTRNRFLEFCENGLEEILDRQIRESFRGDHELIKKMIQSIICLHDIGKLNPAFQKIKLSNSVASEWRDSDTNHSEVGWLMFMAMAWDKIDQISDDGDYLNAVILTTTIAGHHTYAWGIGLSGKCPNRENMERVKKIAQIAGFELNADNCNKVLKFWSNFDKNNKKITPTLFSLYKTLYSALILSDSIATSDAKEGVALPSEKITDKDIAHWRMAFSNTKHMQNLSKSLDKLKIPLNKIDDINILRAKILLETQSNLEKGVSDGKRVFYLEAPTGAGKTNCSINLALRVLELDKTIKHAVFVFPFINIIEQNVEIIKKAISAKSHEVLEVHHLSEWGPDNDENKDIGYASARYDQRLFLNSKITMTSSVNFLEALGSSRKKSNYKIWNMSNSVIVMDEIQSLDDEQWTYLNFLLDKFANDNNCYIILMSATLPRIDRIGFTENKCDFLELLPNAEEYQNHACFQKRANIRPNFDINTVEEVIEIIKQELQTSSRPIKVLAVMNTIKRSKELYDSMPREFDTAAGKRKFNVMLLNSELLPHKKKEVIKAAKTKDIDLVVVSTQCIEAGVDADFDFGIRDYAILDSIEQVAGRINRENKKKSAFLHIVNIGNEGKYDSKTIYGRGRRWAAMESMGKEKIEKIIAVRDYDDYYAEILNIIQEKNKSGNLRDIRGRTETKNAEALRLYALKDFRAIRDDRKISFFIPIDLPIDVFSEGEQSVLKSLISGGGVVPGKSIWKEYERIRETPGREGIIRMAKFASILAKFIANRRVRPGEKQEETISMHENWEEFYTLDKGFIDSDGIF